jgi:hypothetical protein
MTPELARILALFRPSCKREVERFTLALVVAAAVVPRSAARQWHHAKVPAAVSSYIILPFFY